jgi:Tfp pilus assembly PilM family ATPase
VEAQIGVPTAIVDSVATFNVSSKVKKEALEADSPAMMTVVGLAMRTFD